MKLSFMENRLVNIFLFYNMLENKLYAVCLLAVPSCFKISIDKDLLMIFTWVKENPLFVKKVIKFIMLLLDTGTVSKKFCFQCVTKVKLGLGPVNLVHTILLDF